MHTFFEVSFSPRDLVAKLHVHSDGYKLFDDFENPEGAVCVCLNQLYRIFGHFGDKSSPISNKRYSERNA